MFPLLCVIFQAVTLRSDIVRSPPASVSENIKGEVMELSCTVVKVVFGGRNLFLTVLDETTVCFWNTCTNLTIAMINKIVMRMIVAIPPTL